MQRRVGGRPNLWEHGTGDGEEAEQLVVPVQCLEVHEHRAAGIRRVGDVYSAAPAARQVPQQPGVSGAKRGAAAGGGLAQPVDVLQQPLELPPGEIGRGREAGALAYDVASAVAVQGGRDPVGAGVLPDDRVAVRATCLAVPHHGCLTLIGDADGGEVGGCQPGQVERGANDVLGSPPDLRRVVLHPPGPGKDLLVLKLVAPNLRAVVVEDDEAGAGRALVDGAHEVGHACSCRVVVDRMAD